MTRRYLVDGPQNRKWSVWDFGDEMTVQDGPELTSNVISRIPSEITRRLTAADKWDHVVSAASSIYCAKLLQSDFPEFHKLWS